jgi:hypothetical protein
MRLSKAEREREAAERAEHVRRTTEANEAARALETRRVEEAHRKLIDDADPILQADIMRRLARQEAPIQPAGLRPSRGRPVAQPVLDEAGIQVSLVCFGKGFGNKGRSVSLWQLVWSGTGEPLKVGLFASEEAANAWKSSRR